MKNRMLLSVIGLALIAGAFSGCAYPPGDQSSGIIGTIPPGSKFAKISIGMSSGELIATIGGTNYRRIYRSRKSHNPFYFGIDTHRTEIRYPGEGRITFINSRTDGSVVRRVHRIEYDPSETGYIR